MSLTRYKKMRRFDETPEPAGGESSEDAPIFVVQLHHASHRHYDFRLEHDGVLKSWSVPKGPSFDPSIKRLAVEVEDHPIDYAGFEGIIPAGNYGAGDVRIFDHGTWSTDGDVDAQLKKGHLHFALHGDKLAGAWDLIRTHGKGPKPQWLLVKVDDDEAGPFESDDLLGDPDDYHLPKREWHSNRASKDDATDDGATDDGATDDGASDLAKAPRQTIDAGFFEPELARAIEAPPSGDDWIHEPKWDGYRLLAAVANKKVRLWSRNGIEWTNKVAHVADAIAKLGAKALRLDGELVAMQKAGKVSAEDFNSLQAALSGTSDVPLRYVVFDILHADGVDLSKMPLHQRKQMLHAIVEQLGHDGVVVEGAYTTGDGKAYFDRLVREGYEGIVSKRVGSIYRAGRGDDWRKLRAREAEEVAIVGYTDPRGTRAGIGALAMAKRAGKSWDYVGRVGTGMSHELLERLGQELPKLARSTPPVRDESLESPRKNGELKGIHWIEPKLTLEVEFRGKSTLGILRHPSVKSLRLDKRAKDLVPDTDPRSDKPVTVHVTHPERVVYPEPGYTKGDVFAYYDAVADLVLAEIADRPLALVRCPDGPAGKCFFQKHTTPSLGKNVHGVDVKDTAEHATVRDREGLLQLAQMNVIEIHAWGCRNDDVEHCDRLVFDLDPADDVPWKRVVTTAQGMKKSLEAIGLTSFLRLSGGKGVHIVVPLDPPAPWDEAKGFAHALASAMAKQAPDEIIDVMTKAHRNGKIFIDYLRNGRGATSVASYSLRRHPEATVAMPIEWTELARIAGPKAFDLRSALDKVKKRKRDPWAGIGDVKQKLPKVK